MNEVVDLALVILREEIIDSKSESISKTERTRRQLWRGKLLASKILQNKDHINDDLVELATDFTCLYYKLACAVTKDEQLEQQLVSMFNKMGKKF